MQVTHLKISGLSLIQPKVHGDQRGFFIESFNKDNYAGLVGVKEFVQDNHSKSQKNVLRGLHYQTSRPQGKLVRVTNGEVFDVAVDMRRSSQTFGKWEAVILSSENHKQFWIPPGFAHGFYVLSEFAEFQYKVTEYWDPKCEVSLLYNDPELAIDWPCEKNYGPILSQKDASGITINNAPTFT
jgi:dTDP-4-dehydrorhamnose 3,5-epimerase